MDRVETMAKTGRHAAVHAPRLGLAFGGGLPFGAVAIGVIDVFKRNGIPIDCLAGVSMGSVIGLLYCAGYDAPEIEREFTHFFTRRSLIPALLRDLRPSRAGFVRGNAVLKILTGLVPESLTFEELRLPFAVPAADLLTGQEVVFRTGPVLPAIRASISLPGIFTPVPWGDTYLVDGAVISPIPVHLLDMLGADLKIPMRAVRQRPDNVRQRIADASEALAPPQGHRAPPDLLRLLWRTMSLIMQDQFAEYLFEKYDIYIKPQIPYEIAVNPERVGEIIDIGRREAERHVPAIRAALAALAAASAPPPPAPS